MLNKHRVRHVVIGAFAAIAQQAPIPATRDIDLTPEDSPENLERLSDALRALDARIRAQGARDGLPFDHDGSSLGAGAMWTLICPDGEFDISFRPSGFGCGFEDLIDRAHLVRVADVEVMVADLDDVIRSKEEAGRPKDLRVLPLLYRHRDSRGPSAR
ncbi:MAG: hypothetical protein GEU71_13710 [Actinobacteria bacterium]|nr:hypothetical protein [Actinomycetota bacterium]